MREAALMGLMAAPPPPPPTYAPGAPARERTGLPTAGGVLNIVGGVVALVAWIWFLWTYLALVAAVEAIGGEVTYTGFWGLGYACLVLPLIGAIFAILGGVMALKRKSWGLALTGSIIGMLFGGGIFCLIALILIAISRKEFA